jgi:hypothetical protein
VFAHHCPWKHAVNAVESHIEPIWLVEAAIASFAIAKTERKLGIMLNVDTMPAVPIPIISRYEEGVDHF